MRYRGLRGVVLVAGLFVLAGCGTSSETKPDKATEKPADPKTGAPKHGEWWCDEHGIPEEECGICHDKIRNRLKPEEKCAQHPDRKAEQCFICNPDKWPASAARYKARYPGQEPPQPHEENWPKKK